jgi:hypothetical protein
MNAIWALTAGGIGDEIANSVAVDGSRNCFSAGYIGSATVAFGSTILTSNGTTDMYIAKSDNLPVSGITDRSPVNTFYVFPNPAEDFMVIHVPGMSSAEIFDIRGQLCKRFALPLPGTRMDISDLASGIYLIKVTNGTKSLTAKFIKE